MLKNIICIIYLLLSTVMVNAQEHKTITSDSLFFYAQDLNETSLALKNATQLNYSNIKQSSIATLKANRTVGHFRTAQQAEYETVANFHTEGISTLNRFKVAGYFSYERTWQDSLAWSSKGLEIDAQPYFYAAQKAGTYERQKYTVGGILSYNLLKERLYISAGIDYLYNMATRSVDPRPAANTFSLILTPELTYRWNNGAIGVSYLYGYGDERLNIGIKNGEFVTGNKYPERRNYLIESFVFDDIATGYKNSMTRTDSFHGAGLNYAVNFSKLHLKAGLNYKYWLENNVFRTTTDVTAARLKLGDFQLSTLMPFLMLSYKGNNTDQQVYLNANFQSGNDFNYKLYSTNYEYNSVDIFFSYLNLIKNKSGKFQPEFGLSVNYYEQSKKDFISRYYFGYNYLQSNLSFTAYRKMKHNDKLSIGLEPGFRKSLSSDIPIVSATSINAFIAGVVIPDQYYWASDAGSVKLKLNYITHQLIKGFTLGFGTNVLYQHQLNNKLNTNPSNYASDGRLITQFKINLYL